MDGGLNGSSRLGGLVQLQAVAVWRRAEKLLKTFDWKLQSKLDHLPEEVLSSSSYLDRIFQVLDVIAGEKESSDKRRSVRAALYEGSRRNDESLAAYAVRREAQFTGAEKYLTIPEEVKAFMLEEQSGLNRQGLQNLRVLTGGRHQYQEVHQALQVLDTEEESMFKPTGKGSYLAIDESVGNYKADDDDASDSEEEADQIFFSLEQQNLTEDDALLFLADWQGKRRSWKENKQLKAARKKDRRHFEDRGSRPSRPANKRRLSIEELKKVTKCANCQQKGHWREECPHPPRPRGSSSSCRHGSDEGHKGKSKGGSSAFVFLGLPSASSGHFSHFGVGSWHVNLAETYSSNAKDEVTAWLALPAGEAIVVPGACQDFIGLPAFERLKGKLATLGLRPVILKESPSSASGIGGKARPLFSALTPCSLGGFPGVVKLTVLEEDIPHLLSIGLLEMAKSVIDTESNVIQCALAENGYRPPAA